MRAVAIDVNRQTLVQRELPDPVPGKGELLVSVVTSGINRADLLQREGTYQQAAFPQGETPVAGMEAAGEVVAVGAGVTGFAPGDRVMGICAGGCAELALLDHRLAMPIPDELGWVAAGATPLGLMTEYDALVNAAGLRPGETVLISGASSGVGLMGVQIAKALGAGRVLATVRSEASRATVLDQGADKVLTSGKPPAADVVIDHVGGPAFAELMACLTPEGRLVSVGRLGGRATELDLNLLAKNRLRLIGVTFRTRSRAECAKIAADAWTALGDAVRAGRIRPVIARTFPMDQALTAQDLLRGERPPGKVVVTIRPGR
ncbi:NAD(P)H quinone oxidoreductase [Actinomadura sp. NBRC 104412]|uniref:zinc-binding dehydrogenase n=1 Tax=Actinomadura sp. NBRC 104412 TaxID=3032203 RepID=UPI0024A55673|nr:zinc-binding dehydrogenase [Actinomadura sp. NBRC 104412]GLZ08143.1 NAD(P)H quinone oxidoreductase [Actinomadura sp. NBRC 104412]